MKIYIVDALTQEHMIIERFFWIFEILVQRFKYGKGETFLSLEKCLDFAQNFVDKCHIAKEEEVLFPALEARGIPREGGPIEVMLEEHKDSRRFLKTLEEAMKRYAKGDKRVKYRIVRNAQDYSAHLFQHIRKENRALYPIANEVLFAEEQEKLAEECTKNELKSVGGKYTEYVRFIKGLDAEVIGKTSTKHVPYRTLRQGIRGSALL